MRKPRRSHRRWLLASLVVAASCASSRETGEATGRPIELEIERVQPEYAPAFDALSAALQSGDDATARGIITSLRLRGVSGRELELVIAAERVLDGREMVRKLDMRLESSAVAESPGAFYLELVVSHSDERDLVLNLPPASLKRRRTEVAPKGALLGKVDDRIQVRSSDWEGHSLDVVHVDALTELAIAPGAEVRIPLATYNLPVGLAMAVRDRWSLAPRSGEIVVEDRSLPAKHPPVRPFERVRLAAYIPTGAVDPAELARYVREDEVLPPAIMERAVRIPPERWDEALDLLAVAEPELSDERIEELSLCVRWLLRTGSRGEGPADLRRFFERRRRGGGSGEAPAPSQLDLPEPEVYAR